MTRASPSVAVGCTGCGGVGELAFDDAFVDGRLRYWEAFRCSTCSTCYEADGLGRLPDGLRRVAIAHHALCVDPGTRVPRLATLRAMRAIFGGTPSEARARWEALLAGEPMTVGEAAELRSLVPGIAFIECAAGR